MWDFIIQNFNEFLTYTGFANASVGNLIMIVVGAVFIYLAIKKDFEPLLLVPIGLGIILGNIPFRADAGLEIGLYEDNSVLNIFYQGVRQGWYPPLIFLGIGAMTDFSALLANPKLMLIGAAAQFGIFGAYMPVLQLSLASLVPICWRWHWALSLIRLQVLPSSVGLTVLPPSSCQASCRPTSWEPSPCVLIAIWR